MARPIQLVGPDVSPDRMEGTSTLLVDLDAITHNVGALRSLGDPDVRFCAVLKADGYGLGAPGIAKAIAGAGGAMLAVFSPEEAGHLLEQNLPILVLMPARGENLSDHIVQAVRTGRLHFVVHDARQMESLDALGLRLGTRVPVHLKIDTGLHRGGCGSRDAVVLVRAIQRSAGLVLTGLMTHFAQAASCETTTANQMRQLCSIRDSIGTDIPPDVIVHAAGTCGLLRGADYHADMVRIGLGWSGYLTPAASSLVGRLPVPLQPSVTWRSRIALVRTIACGERVGYGGRWIAERPTRLGVIPVGYADGYPQDGGHPVDGGPGLAVGLPSLSLDEQATVPIIGRVSMDQIMVDLTDAPQETDVETPVDLISAMPGSACGLENLSRRLKRPPHAILVQIHARITRRHISAQKPLESRQQILAETGESCPLSSASAVAG
ncbi:MAG: alanine racemase [Planctomycetota bacterium]|nr:alanine racemase [Planctomycetota bacterium]